MDGWTVLFFRSCLIGRHLVDGALKKAERLTQQEIIGLSADFSGEKVSLLSGNFLEYAVIISHNNSLSFPNGN